MLGFGFGALLRILSGVEKASRGRSMQGPRSLYSKTTEATVSGLLVRV